MRDNFDMDVRAVLLAQEIGDCGGHFLAEGVESVAFGMKTFDVRVLELPDGGLLVEGGLYDRNAHAGYSLRCGSSLWHTAIVLTGSPLPRPAGRR